MPVVKNLMDIELTPIGEVKNEVESLTRADSNAPTSDVIIYEQFAQALDCVEDFSDLLIIYWMDKLFPYERLVMRVHPQGKKDMPLVGVFACRSPARPNPIAITRVKLLGRDGTTLKVSGLDAVNGSPVIDIKPYIPRNDLSGELRLPDWIEKMK